MATCILHNVCDVCVLRNSFMMFKSIIPFAFKRDPAGLTLQYSQLVESSLSFIVTSYHYRYQNVFSGLCIECPYMAA